MRLGGRFTSWIAEEFVMSSGTTDGFETYDFDYKASSVRIAAVFSSPGEFISISEEPTTDGFEWSSDSNEAISRTLFLSLAGYFMAERHGRGVHDHHAGFQSFDLTGFADQYVTSIGIEMKGTGSGAPGFAVLDPMVLGAKIDNPSDTFYVGSTFIEFWSGNGLPDFVGTGSGDQNAINGAICAVKKGTFDGVDCIDMDETATGTVDLSWVRTSWTATSSCSLAFSSSANRRRVDPRELSSRDRHRQQSRRIWPRIDLPLGCELPDFVVARLTLMEMPVTAFSASLHSLPKASLCLVPSVPPLHRSMPNTLQNVTCEGVDIRYCSGDALVVRDSTLVSIDAGRYDEHEGVPSVDYRPKPRHRSDSRHVGLRLSSPAHVTRQRRGGSPHHGLEQFYLRSNHRRGPEGAGNVGSVDGQQPIEVIVESSSLVKFQDKPVQSVNDPVMTITDSTTVSFTNGGYSNVPSGTCTIQADDPSTVTIDADEDELVLEGTCYVKV
ncbi:hypothetical protein Esi_0270_0027 [Ectocarpus siliculosus]|uniref:Uncharacterized protein n=1 Tax=Ectocarpus siliculosus TaxID=2880 RepID=D7FUI8_ECTSI|nr:hypothetical protein Esi_0270_0027 [Ectocarpus siliculosus]|eukprot:CBJ31644.1 hypothetical protein Esi_0270_0027 [Ectocarpus siliculosus]